MSAESTMSARTVSLPDKSWSRLQRLAAEHGMTEDQILEVAIDSFARCGAYPSATRGQVLSVNLFRRDIPALCSWLA